MKHDLRVAVLGVALLATVASLSAQQGRPAADGRAGSGQRRRGAVHALAPLRLEPGAQHHLPRAPNGRPGFHLRLPVCAARGRRRRLGGGHQLEGPRSRSRNAAGKPQLFEFDQNHKLVRAIGDDVIGHQNKAHGMAVDADDNIWICDENGDTVMKLSPEGKLLMTIGVRGQRGDWDEAKGQRLLWQPLHLAFAPNGDIYIGEGHANESPNDTDKSPANNIGAARVLHLDKNGRFINQWFGNHAGQGHFSMVHGIAINPDNGNVYLADREEYRLVVYDARGKFIKTIQLRNLTCALYVDPHKQLWLATGQDGQIFKIDWDGNVLGAIGNGPGNGEGQFTESSYMAMDAQGNLYTGDTGFDRIDQDGAVEAGDTGSAALSGLLVDAPPYAPMPSRRGSMAAGSM